MQAEPSCTTPHTTESTHIVSAPSLPSAPHTTDVPDTTESSSNDSRPHTTDWLEASSAPPHTTEVPIGDSNWTVRSSPHFCVACAFADTLQKSTRAQTNNGIPRKAVADLAPVPISVLLLQIIISKNFFAGGTVVL
jgi:hypothetical protein